MKTAAIVTVFLIGCFLVLLAMGREAYPSGSWRYKLTVTVETPEGLKSGSAVREVMVITGVKKSSEASYRGEAVVVDLGKRGVLFALIDKDNEIRMVTETFPSAHGARTPDGVRYYSQLQSEPRELAESLYPRFVRFHDLNNPKTVENLIELEKCAGRHSWPEPLCIKKNRFAEAFGEGVHLKYVEIKMTGEGITMGKVDQFLPWLYPRMISHTRGPIGGTPDKPFEDPTGTYLTSDNFVEGEK